MRRRKPNRQSHLWYHHQTSAIIHHPSAISHQTSSISHQPSDIIPLTSHHLFDNAIGVTEDTDGTQTVEQLRGACWFDYVNARNRTIHESEGGEPTLYCHIVERLVHQLRAVGILLVERSCWRREVRQRVVTQIGISPSAIRNSPAVIGLENCITLYFVAIGSIVYTGPDAGVVVYVEDDDPATGPVCWRFSTM